MTTAPEVTMVCMDNSFWMNGHPVSDVQVAAVKLYCETKFRCNEENRVGLFRMATYHYGIMLSPTNDPEPIFAFLPGVCFECGGEAEFFLAVKRSCDEIAYDFPNMKKRVLVFVASPISLHWADVETLGKYLKGSDVALDVVNFFNLGEDRSRVEYSILYGQYHYGREQLGELLTYINDNGNSRIVDIFDAEEHKVLGKLKLSILRKHVRYIKKKDKKKAKKNVEVKQERGPEKNEAAILSLE